MWETVSIDYSPMISFDDLLNRVTRQRPDVHFECRHCGETLSKDDAACQACGSREIADIPL